jgi:hypothetical protein
MTDFISKHCEKTAERKATLFKKEKKEKQLVLAQFDPTIFLF